MYKNALLIAILLCCGCGPELTKEDLGKIDRSIPDVSDIAEGYHLPDLSSEGSEGEDNDGPTPTESTSEPQPTAVSPADSGPTPVEEPSEMSDTADG